MRGARLLAVLGVHLALHVVMDGRRGVARADVAVPAAAVARADVAVPAAPPVPAAAESPPFWEAIAAPHRRELERLLAEARMLRDVVAPSYHEVHEAPERAQVLAAAFTRFAQASALAPERRDLLEDAAHAALDAGDPWHAASAYSQLRARREGEPDFLLAYNEAEAMLRLGELAAAGAVLERALPAARSPQDRLRGAVLRGYALMSEGALDDAIEVIARATDSSPLGPGSDALALTVLAVALDRDEQLTRAVEVLAQVRQLDPEFSFLTTPFFTPATTPPGARYSILFAPASDRHYFAALAYEARGQLAAAAAEWRQYAGAEEPRYRHRAEAHLAELGRRLADAARRAGRRSSIAGQP